MANIKFENITKSYDGRENIIENFNLEVDSGDFLVLLGPSGSGKSTLLRILAGLEEITSGKVYIDDEPVNDKEPKDRNIAMVFQNYALYPHMTVYKNISISLVLKKEGKKEIDEKVKKVAKLLDISELLDRKPRQLSGGQMQRVALARALIRNPKVFLMDEPLSNLDSKLRIQTRAEIMKLYRELFVTTVYVTHDQVEAMTMATKIALLNKGKIMQLGTPDDLYNKPENKFVASFIGAPQMNFFAGKVEDYREGENTLRESYREMPIENGKKHLNKSSTYSDESNYQEVIVGVRADNLFLEKGQDYIVELIENLGSEKLIYLYKNFDNKNDFDKAAKKKQEIVVRTNAEFQVKIGDKFNIKIDENKIHLFHKITEKRIELENISCNFVNNEFLIEQR